MISSFIVPVSCRSASIDPIVDPTVDDVVYVLLDSFRSSRDHVTILDIFIVAHSATDCIVAHVMMMVHDCHDASDHVDTRYHVSISILATDILSKST